MSRVVTGHAHILQIEISFGLHRSVPAPLRYVGRFLVHTYARARLVLEQRRTRASKSMFLTLYNINV